MCFHFLPKTDACDLAFVPKTDHCDLIKVINHLLLYLTDFPDKPFAVTFLCKILQNFFGLFYAKIGVTGQDFDIVCVNNGVNYGVKSFIGSVRSQIMKVGSTIAKRGQGEVLTVAPQHSVK